MREKKQMDKTENVEHTGRSMVEMLGVLAIVGVLTTTALYGFDYAIRVWKTNQTMTDVNLLAMDFSKQMSRSRQFQGGEELVSDEFGTMTTLGYDVFAQVDADPNYFIVSLSGVPADVCEQILRSYTFPYEMYAGSSLYEEDNEAEICAGDPELSFVFGRDFQPKQSE